MGQAEIRLRKKFKNRFVSVSRIKLYEKCPFAFARRYIKKSPRKPNPAADFGILEHGCLERIFRWVCDEEFVGQVDDELIIQCFRAAFEDSDVTGNDSYQEGLKLIRNHFGDQPNVDHTDVLAVERKFVIEIDGIEVLGYIDRVDRIDGETILIDDYKTNRFLFSREEMDTDLQMGVYGLAAKEEWPWAKHVRFRYDMLRHNIPLYTDRTEQQLRDTADYVVAMTRRIESCKKFEARLNPLCPWCDERDDCKTYQAALEEGESSLSYLVSAKNMEKVCAEWKRAKALEIIAKKRREEMAEIIEHHLRGEQLDQLVVDGMRYRLAQRVDRVYPHHSKVVEVLSKGLKIPESVVADKILSVDKGSLDSLLKASNMTRAGRQLVEAKLETLSRKNPKRPYVDGREHHERKA